MRIQLIYSVQDRRRYDWDFVPCVGDFIWNESVEVTGEVYKVVERHIALDRYGKIDKISLNLTKGLH